MEENKEKNVEDKLDEKVEDKVVKEEPKKEKKSNKTGLLIFIISILIVVAIILGIIFFPKPKKENKLKVLPKPEITTGQRGELGIDKNINESNIDEYLGRPDAVYRDMRLLEDPAKYENIGGDRFLSGYIKGFEIVSLPYLIPVSGLPEEVGDTYIGNTLFHIENNTYVPNYEESMSILEELFPKDKVIFLMCGGGGYAGMTKNLLVSLGWNSDKIYNIGGHWYYKGKNNVEVKKVDEEGKITYDFDSVPYHKIEFDKFTKLSSYKAPEYKVTELKISTEKIEIEESSTFKLNVIVLPNDAADKTVKWSSSDESIAVVSDDGTVKGVKAGMAIITVESTSSNIKKTCEVVVNKKKKSLKAVLDDIKSEFKEFDSYDDELNTIYDYYEYPESDYMVKKIEIKKSNILNKLMNEKKSFVVAVKLPSCGLEDYQIARNTKDLLESYGYNVFFYDPSMYAFENIMYGSTNFFKSILIVKDGKIFKQYETDTDSIKSREDLINWLSRYIEL